MPERKKNTWKRQLISFNPNFRIDTSAPLMGESGTDVYKIYAVTDRKDSQNSLSLSSSGLFSIHNDRTIEISAGAKNRQGREDIVIVGNSGNISITASQGMVRIHATDIMIDAERDIHFKAGRNINLVTGGGRIMFDGGRVDIEGSSGNLISQLGKDFTKLAFQGSFIGIDFIENITGPIVNNVINNVIDKVIPGGGLLGSVAGGLLGGGGLGSIVGNVAGGLLGGGGLGDIVGNVAGGLLGGGGLGDIVGDVAGGLLGGGGLGDIVGDVAGGVLSGDIQGAVTNAVSGVLGSDTGNIIGNVLDGDTKGILGDVGSFIGGNTGRTIGNILGDIAN
jgi:hypothetical protein